MGRTQRKSRRHPAFEDKQREATERVTAWRSLAPETQEKELDKRLGKGKGAAKQRAKFKLIVGGKP